MNFVSRIQQWPALLLSTLLGGLVIMMDFGFETTTWSDNGFRLTYLSIAGVIAAISLGEWIRPGSRAARRRQVVMLVAALGMLIVYGLEWGLWHASDFPRYPWVIFFLVTIMVELARRNFYAHRLYLQPASLFAGSFALTILVGTFMLLLPTATVHPISLVDALFTATSAVSVTGLAVLDTGVEFTRLGQVIIMVLIQAGGLGMMTFTSFFSFFFKGQTSLQERLTLLDLTSTSLESVQRFIIHVVLFTLGVELIGAVLIYSSIGTIAWPNVGERLFFSVFHAVSGFCNAGFSTLSDSLFTSETRFLYALQGILMALFVLGGIGYFVSFGLASYLRTWLVYQWQKRRWPDRKLVPPRRLRSLNSRLALRMSLLLLLVGWGGFLMFEWNHSLAEHSSWGGKLLAGLFGGATPRTAGFNNVDTGQLSAGALLLTLFLMWIGASPGSTGGGIKTTTFAVALLNIHSIARGRERLILGPREISHNSLNRAFAVVVLSLLVIGVAVILITLLQPDSSLMVVVFECVSAFSTVGLSMGLTGELCTASRLVIVAVMFIGRVSALSILIGLLRRLDSQPRVRYPKEDVLIN
jgi:Trk-type K+ transport system membrane component